MKLATYTLCTISALSLMACSASIDPNARIKGDGYNIDIDSGHGSNGKFCPPGQAKKGNC